MTRRERIFYLWFPHFLCQERSANFQTFLSHSTSLWAFIKHVLDLRSSSLVSGTLSVCPVWYMCLHTCVCWCLARCPSFLCGICVCIQAYVLCSPAHVAMEAGGPLSAVFLYHHFILVFETGALTEQSLPFQWVWLAKSSQDWLLSTPSPFPVQVYRLTLQGPLFPLRIGIHIHTGATGNLPTKPSR